VARGGGPGRRDEGGDGGNKTAFFRRLQESALSPSHRTIARYVARNYRIAASQTAAEVAATVKTSEATVIRFALRLGYTGYPELRRQLHRMIYEDLTSIELLGRPLPQKGGSRDTLTTVVQTEIEHLRALAADLPREEFTRLVKGLQAADRVYVVGHRASAPLAEFLGYTLAKVHQNVVTLTQTGSLACDAFRAVPASGWLVAVAFPRYPRDTVQIVEFAREEGITVAAITDTVLSPVAKRADLVLPVQAEPISFVDSHCAPQALVAALLVEYGLRARERTEALLGRFERVAARHGIFHGAE
jgi:DNA-binding MurR/RpiR family transcriptional regulator